MVTGSRGQVILIAAVIFAVTVLVSVALLSNLQTPADINTQSDSRSLETIERTGPALEDDLERIFLVHTSVDETGERVPYANESSGPDDPFGAVVANYSSVYSDMAVSDTSTVVSVEYLNTSRGSLNGTLLRHNDSSKNLTFDGFNDTKRAEWNLTEDAESMPYFHLNVTDTPDDPFLVNISDDTLEFTDDSVAINGDNVFSNGAYPVEVELIDGVGEVRNGSDRTAFEPDPDAYFDVTFGNGNETNGTYTVSATNTSVGSELVGNETGDHQYTRTDVVLAPSFRMTYTDPNVRYVRFFRLYNDTST